MSENVKNRDDAQAEVESLTSTKSSLNAEDAKLAKEISTLAKDIASLQKALKEATELRNAEKAENENTIATAKEGKSGVDLALKILSEFYSGAAGGAFVQYVPPNSDRSGKTVGDLAPEVFNSDNKGSQSESKGIIGILEVIQSDFDRTIAKVTEDEGFAAEEFDMFKGATEEDISDKSTDKKTKDDRVAAIADELVENANSLKDENEKLTISTKSLSELKKQCIDGEETYEERVAKREKEIAALKEAHGILENWQA
jgi:chromosome segregation ATPase